MRRQTDEMEYVQLFAVLFSKMQRSPPKMAQPVPLIRQSAMRMQSPVKLKKRVRWASLSQ